MVRVSIDHMLHISLPPTSTSSPEQSEGFQDFARSLEISRWKNQNNKLSEQDAQGYKVRKDVAKGEQ
jgi:hypothetical protein